MPATVNGGGDQLARGAVSVKFRSSESGTSQQKWDDIFGADSGPKKNYAEETEKETKPKKVRKNKS